MTARERIVTGRRYALVVLPLERDSETECGDLGRPAGGEMRWAWHAGIRLDGIYRFALGYGGPICVTFIRGLLLICGD
jgi:hypothetical protein